MRHALAAVPGARFGLSGVVGDSLRSITEQWLIPAPDANPAMLEMFADRDVRPYRDMVPWAGEFAGKYLTSAVEVWRLTRDPELGRRLRAFTADLVGLQDDDGYLGPWPRDCRFTNRSPHHGDGGMETWDTWGHYHIMIGMIGWHEASGDARAISCATRIADALCSRYLGARAPRLVDTGSTEMNLAPAHALAILHRMSGRRAYVEMAEQWVGEFAARKDGRPLAGDYLEQALAGKQFYEMPRPRWESLHPVMALAELHRITGQPRYRDAFERIWKSIAAHDRHNNGGFSSGEKATGNPYDPDAIETCCTIAWIALSVEMLKMTGDSTVADEIEMSTLNSVLGMHSRSGRWATYNTPSDGVRVAAMHDISFQARPGSPELNCCSVNSPRGLGMIGAWAAMRRKHGFVLNYYGPSRIALPIAGGRTFELVQDTRYPAEGVVTLDVNPSETVDVSLDLRIPRWSNDTRVEVNGAPVRDIRPGTYLAIRRSWRPGDRVEIEFDVSPYTWRGERECAGLVSCYRGPLLLAYDPRYNPGVAAREPSGADRVPGSNALQPVPQLEVPRAPWHPVAWESRYPPILLLPARATTGEQVLLCDFARAGETGTPYRSWLPARQTPGASTAGL